MLTISAKRIRSIFSQVPEKKIAVIGDYMLDVYVWGQVERISPEAPVPVVSVQKTTRLPGGAANVVKNLSSLGAEPLPVGVVGEDANGEILTGLLGDLCPDLSGMVSDGSRPTSVKTRIMAHHQQVVRTDEESLESIGGTVASTVEEKMKTLVGQVDAVIIEDYNKGVITSRITPYIRAFRKKGAFVSVDPKLRNFAFYKGASLIKPNRKETAAMMGAATISDTDVPHAAKKILRDYGLDSVVITLGEQGIVLYEKSGDYTQYPSLAHDVFDVTGAGDTVISCISCFIVAGATMKEAVFLANHAAGIVVGEVGTASVTLDQLRASI